jgi:hypothetical protein
MTEEKISKIGDDLKHQIENSIYWAERGITTGMLLCKDKENSNRYLVADRTDKGMDDLDLRIFPRDNNPEIKAIMIVLPYEGTRDFKIGLNNGILDIENMTGYEVIDVEEVDIEDNVNDSYKKVSNDE